MNASASPGLRAAFVLRQASSTSSLWPQSNIAVFIYLFLILSSSASVHRLLFTCLPAHQRTSVVWIRNWLGSFLWLETRSCVCFSISLFWEELKEKNALTHLRSVTTTTWMSLAAKFFCFLCHVCRNLLELRCWDLNFNFVYCCL